jgi:hypothetical protein
MGTSFQFRLFTLMAAGATLNHSPIASAEPTPCLSTYTVNYAAAWRVNETHGFDDPAQPISPTHKTREGWIQAQVKLMTKAILDERSTPAIEFFASPKITLEWVESGRADHYGSIYRANVTHLPSNGILMGTLLLPVSGHVGKENALAWAKSDTYTLFVKTQNQSTPIASHVSSLGLVTLHDRSGSLGVSGFTSGRSFKILWDGSH